MFDRAWRAVWTSVTAALYAMGPVVWDDVVVKVNVKVPPVSLTD
jgi:hypothetical protein